jgi:hypothetical protein
MGEPNLKAYHPVPRRDRCGKFVATGRFMTISD